MEKENHNNQTKFKQEGLKYLSLHEINILYTVNVFF